MAELKLSEDEKEQRSYLNYDDETLGKIVKKKAIEFEDYFGENVTEREAALVSLISRVAKGENDMAMMEVEGVKMNDEDLGHWRITFEKVDPDLPGGPPDPDDLPDDDDDDKDGEGGVLIP